MIYSFLLGPVALHFVSNKKFFLSCKAILGSDGAWDLVDIDTQGAEPFGGLNLFRGHSHFGGLY